MTKKIKLDRIDLRILSILQHNARITNQALAEEVGLSPSPCLQRVRKLESASAIGTFRATINLDKIATSVSVIATVSLNNHEPKDFEKFEQVIADLPEVVECNKVSGPFDYFLRIICFDVASYNRLSDQLLIEGPSGIRLSSHVVLTEPKRFEGVALDRLMPYGSK